MTKQLTCRDAGFDCDFHIESEHEDELIDFVQIHARSIHDKDMSDSDVREMLQST